MNRAERRKMKKNGYNERGQKIYRLTQKQLDDMLVKAISLKRQEILDDISSRVTRTLMVFCLDVLHNKFGFGEMRLKRFKYYLDEISELVVEEYGDVDGLCESLGEQINLEFMTRQIERGEIYSPSYFGEFEQLAPYPTQNKENDDEITES